MDWKLTTISYGGGPSREGTRTFSTEAAFDSAAREALADLRAKVVSANLPNGTDLNVAELRRRYTPTSR
jgi:hypothetical protein